MKSRPSISIYGLFSESGECLYIGRTRNLEVRRRQHVWGGRKFHKIAELKHVDFRHRLQAESEMIRKYKTIGQAVWNKNIGSLNGQFVKGLKQVRIRQDIYRRLKRYCKQCGEMNITFMFNKIMAEQLDRINNGDISIFSIKPS